MLVKEANSPYYVFLDEADEVYDTYIQDLILQWSELKKNAVVTACDSKYFKSCLTLITSLYKHSDNDIDTIYVFNLGLSEDEQCAFIKLKKVKFKSMLDILEYTKDIRINFPNFLVPYQFAYKSWFIRYVFEHSDIENVFWIDSGIAYRRWFC